ncbi:MAG: DNA internalization-related competence protein ComEC/Rec2 [Chloroflexi bacterium]|nr:DNA internalization-related competence protein ComEC/Rec2 [Chloroflexota bacterium]
MGTGRFALPLALAGVGGGILSADLGLASSPAILLVAGFAMLALGSLLGPGSGSGGCLLLIGVVLGFAALGTWRHAATDPSRPTAQPSVASLVDGDEHELIGTVMDDPRPREDRMQVVLGELEVVFDGRRWELGDRLLVWMPRGIDARSGDRLRVRARVEMAEDFDGFAYREYLARQGVGAIGRPRFAEVVEIATGPEALLVGVRNALLHGLNGIVPEPEAALGAGILLGVRASIAPEINDAFATAGLTHVVAISGWNIAIVAALVAAMVRPLERRPGGRWTTALVAALTVGGYVVLTGASPSVVRAALMAAAMLVARLGGSRAHAASALGLAALVMLLVAPAVLWDVGFQLSLLATAGLIWFGGAVERRLPGWPAWIREPVALTLAAQLTTLPIVLVNFERLSLVAPIANILVVPFVPITMLFSAIASLAGVLDGTVHIPVLSDAMSWFAGGAAWLVLRVIVSLGMAVASLPYAAVDVSIPPPVAIAWLPILGLATWALGASPAADRSPDERAASAAARVARRLVRPLPVGLVLVGILLAVTVVSRPDGRLHLTILDVGQGDAILLETPAGRTMLIDGGPDPELTLRRLGANLPFFARRIDLMVLSHPHQDHVAGLVEVLDRFQVGAVLHAGIPFDNPSYARLIADVSERDVGITVARAGHGFMLDASTSIEIVYPSAADAAASLPDGDINNGSVVMLVRHGGFTALLTGDAEAPIEATLVHRGALPTVDVLKVGHHGSHSSTTPGLLDAIRPSVAVISSGEDNDYGHPAPETLATLGARAAIAVYRTDRQGDVEVETDGRSYRVRTDAGWGAILPVHGAGSTGSIAPWPFLTDPPLAACWPTPACRMALSSTPRVSPAWRWRPLRCWPRPRSRSTARWWRSRRCCTTSTRSRFGAMAASTASSARDGSRRRATRSSPCRSPPTRSTACSTTIASRAVGPLSWWPWPIGTWPRSS